MATKLKFKNFSNEFKIQNTTIGKGSFCYIIAEAGVAHFGSLEKAKQLVDIAANAGADAVKFQHFNTDNLVSSHSKEWYTRLKSRQITDEMIGQIHDYCKQKKITFLCTAHEIQALNYLDKELNVPAFKIGSGEVENWAFIKDIAARGKPVILSTGMYTLENIEEVIQIFEEVGNSELAVLHCVTSYPTLPKDVNLNVINRLKSIFNGPIGYSDHTVDTAIPIAAIALGARILEKHITIDVNVPNAQDWKVSCTKENFKDFILDIKKVEKAMGHGNKILTSQERKSLKWARKSLVAKRNIQRGEIITSGMLIALRPGDGLSPSQIKNILGLSSNVNISAGEQISIEMFSKT